MGIVKNLFGKTTVYKKWQDKKIASFKKEQELNEKLLIPERKKFYQQFINAGDLVFDVGANEGNRVQVFLDLNANIVAVEPQPNCIEILKQKFDNKIIIENCTNLYIDFDELKIIKEELVSRMQNPFYTNGVCPPWLGMYGFGEFARLGGENTYHNYTTALYVIYR